ncbi:hypothetical protein L3Q82_017692 [Scortum barcoo]|uniref:Uncharacterized protein n=1 Tax=Scortum barcoo TaxID=214431 RepID=A0ACB8VLR8_9TELE|nr:hypothetical protein L3Q82_017692 [Scortum barcoo]
MLRPLVRPYAGAVGPGFLLMQDNARPHVAGVCQQFLQDDEGIDAMDWRLPFPPAHQKTQGPRIRHLTVQVDDFLTGRGGGDGGQKRLIHPHPEDRSTRGLWRA